MPSYLRPARLSDARAVLDIYAPYILGTTVTFEYEVPSLDAFTGRMVKIMERFPYLVWEEDGAVLGYAYASPYHDRAAFGWDAELSVYVREDCRGRQIGKHLYQALIRLLYEMGFYTLYALISVPNPQSFAFHEGFGFKEEGNLVKTGFKMGGWIDLKALSLPLRPREGTPLPVKAFSSLPKPLVEKILAQG